MVGTTLKSPQRVQLQITAQGSQNPAPELLGFGRVEGFSLGLRVPALIRRLDDDNDGGA